MGPNEIELKTESFAEPLFPAADNFGFPSIPVPSNLVPTTNTNCNCWTPLDSPIISSPSSENGLLEIQEYNKEAYEQASGCSRKRTRQSFSEESETNSDGGEDHSVSNAEMRRQIHIQSEQKRRAQIKDGFEELKKHLPNCSNKKISKACILGKTIQHLESMKETQMALMTQLQMMRAENQKLRQFYQVIQQQQHQPQDKLFP
ncbi:helix-loop-helix DNA-binding protein [Basidiobolus meristosporus CBS 931.73]|uniref:Helix-loop-helix DNA-binding protein n=1 Tax=Basidiobolus meristosporus CBS 931.73 TaxID=1314790 RepID=A0A1Y1ZCK2_9FUNG|nr:helix-loop-helix DNA-binding protein [Basidiobolus meristosporus CBS 931.73]|eukprot:ORY07981.1 helix-loop-helix DNA-binding protein [Basidiobolus meristosporus CBS 931.73]